MKQAWKSTICMVLSTLMILSGGIGVFALEQDALEEAINDTAAYIYDTVSNPQVGSIGGEWAVLGLARSGYDVPEEYYQHYYSTVEKYVKACDGVLHEKKYTEYSRLVVALTAIGKDPSKVAGYNLLTALGDYDKTIWQGMNGPIWALIALDSGNYEMPLNPDAKTQATREMYIDRILECQLQDGGWSLFGGTEAASSGDGVSDPDITGMALQALAKYQDLEDVKQATEEALYCMSAQQNDNGGFSSWGTENSESCVQMLVALCELGIPLDDARFVKNGKTMLDNLMTYYEPGKGFSHTRSGSGSNQMATEQGFYALAAAKRALDGASSLYRMTDNSLNVPEPTGGKEQTIGLPGKHTDIQVVGIQHPGKTFADISAHKNQPAIEALAARGIINGKSDNAFEPDATMTRAEFATIIARGLGLPISNANNIFADIEENDWFCSYVNTAYDYGIVNGVSETEFAPNGAITREEAAVMVARAAKLCGMDTEMEIFSARDVLAGFIDYVKASDWAVTSLAFCYDEGILADDTMEIHPQHSITRAEIAQMLFSLLNSAKLL